MAKAREVTDTERKVHTELEHLLAILARIAIDPSARRKFRRRPEIGFQWNTECVANSPNV